MNLSAAAMYEAMTDDQKRATEEIVERNAGKKTEEQKSSKGKNDSD